MDRRYDTYLLRWWHSDGGERAEVQHIQTGERTALPSLAAACSWLLTRYDEAVPLVGSAPLDGHDTPRGKQS
jgi:hypothetical protein